MFAVFFAASHRVEVNFWEFFVRVLPHRPKQALAALYWHLTKRRVRARNLLRGASADLSFPYHVWIERTEKNEARLSEFASVMERWAWHPHFHIILYAPAEHTAEELERSINSVERQSYPSWTLQPGISLRIDDAADADFVIPLRVGDALSEVALFRLAEALQSDSRTAILYGDEDELDPHGQRRRPWFKPRWNEEMFLALDYLSGIAAIRTDLAREASKTARNLSELLLAVSSISDVSITHVPHVLCHAGGRPDIQAERLAAVGRHLRLRGAKCLPGPFGTVKVEWPLPDEIPLVSIIIPTRDMLQFLQPCLRSVLDRTDYGNFEILIVDNDSVAAATKHYFEGVTKDPRVRVLAFPGPYNFSAINNFAARHARGSYLCLLNNDTEVIEPTWLSEMMRYAVRADVGAVGAKLLYDDGSIQHAGVVIGIGGAAGHAHRFLASGQHGYFGQPHAAQFVSAVTAACLMIDKRKFLAVGGLDEAKLPVAFNDVDLCLKLQAAGWRNVYVPHALLVHHESKTRESDISKQNIERFRREVRVLQDRWNTETYDDPLHNPNLDRATETFIVRL